jgi:DNA-3-methyladenine glycosylase II
MNQKILNYFIDPILNDLTNKYPPPTWTDRSAFLFEDMIETIISQQLSGKAADSIFKRFKGLFQTVAFPLPEEVLAVEQGSIRAIGVSNSKASYIHNVARAFTEKEIIIEKIQTMTDEEVIETLTKIKGIGKWSAEMTLIFTLNRPDVFSPGDLGLRNAIKNLYGITETKAILELTDKWKPNRSLASWYLWRSLENR